MGQVVTDNNDPESIHDQDTDASSEHDEVEQHLPSQEPVHNHNNDVEVDDNEVDADDEEVSQTMPDQDDKADEDMATDVPPELEATNDQEDEAEDPAPEDPFVEVDILQADFVQSRPSNNDVLWVLVVHSGVPDDWQCSEA